MTTPACTDVIQGDDQCRDGHYRAKHDLREQTATCDGGENAAGLDPNDPTSLHAKTLSRLATSGSGVAPKKPPASPRFGTPCSTALVKWVPYDPPKLL
jgi:hypothetical protein